MPSGLGCESRSWSGKVSSRELTSGWEPVWAKNSSSKTSRVKPGLLCGKGIPKGRHVCSWVEQLGLRVACHGLGLRLDRPLCTCPICVLGSDLAAAAEDKAGWGHGETPRLCFEQEPGLDSGIGSRPGSSPRWPQINENCRGASSLPPPPRDC